MREDIDFSCRCGRRLTATIDGERIAFLDHGRRLPHDRCTTPGCQAEYSRLTAAEFKDNCFHGY